MTTTIVKYGSETLSITGDYQPSNPDEGIGEMFEITEVIWHKNIGHSHSVDVDVTDLLDAMDSGQLEIFLGLETESLEKLRYEN